MLHNSGLLSDVLENRDLRLKLTARPHWIEPGKPFQLTFQVNSQELSWNGCNNWILAIRGTGKGNIKDRFYAVQTVNVFAGLVNCLGKANVTIPAELDPNSPVRIEIYSDDSTHEEIIAGQKPGMVFGTNPVKPKFVVPRDIVLALEPVSEADQSFYETAKKEAGQALDKAAETTKTATSNLAITAGIIGGIGLLALGTYFYFTQVKQ